MKENMETKKYFYELEDVFTPKANIYNCCVTFYILEGMKSLISTYIKDKTPIVESFLKDLEEYWSWFVPALASALYDYTVLVVWKEMRYFNSCANSNHFEFHHPFFKYSDTPNPSNTVALNILKYASFYSPDTIKKVAEMIFNEYFTEWENNYGGKAWLNIAGLIEDYHKYNNFIFIDRCFDTEHNNGIYLDKITNIFNTSRKSNVEGFLNDKKYFAIMSLIKEYIQQLDSYCIKLTVRFFNIISMQHKDLKNYALFRSWNEGSLQRYSDSFLRILINQKNEIAKSNLSTYALERREPIKWGEEDFTQFIVTKEEK